jgi:hypothetical protein
MDGSVHHGRGDGDGDIRFSVDGNRKGDGLFFKIMTIIYDHIFLDHNTSERFE